jgi:hypothetical protein
MSPFLTSKGNIVLTLLFGWLGESRFNRTMKEYIAIAVEIPKVDAVHSRVN